MISIIDTTTTTLIMKCISSNSNNNNLILQVNLQIIWEGHLLMTKSIEMLLSMLNIKYSKNLRKSSSLIKSITIMNL